MHISAIYKLMGGDGEPDTLYNELRGGSRVSMVKKGQEQFDYKQHDVTKPGLRPDKVSFEPTGEKDPVTGEDKLAPKHTPPARVPLPLQKYIIEQKASFTAGNGVKLRPSDEESQVFRDVYRNWYATKADFFLRTIAKWQMADTQVAVIFYGEREAEDLDTFKFKFMVTGPSEDGATLEPFFDEYRNLTAMGREYKDTSTGENIYDLYIDRNPEDEASTPILRRYRGDGDTYTDIVLPYPKLPVVYWEQDRPECDPVSGLIKELEFGFSDFLTQQGYSADPILFGKGRVLNLPAKGSAGKFVEGSEDSDLKFVTPDNATESRDLQFKLLMKYTMGLSRAVLLDSDTMQGLQEISGAALDRYLIDPYQSATDKQQGEWGIGVQRMVNWLLAAWKDLRGVPKDKTTIDVSFSKYRIEDMRETVEVMLLANGNKPLISHEASISEAGLADEPAEEYSRIQKERETDKAADAPTPRQPGEEITPQK